MFAPINSAFYHILTGSEFTYRFLPLALTLFPLSFSWNAALPAGARCGHVLCAHVHAERLQHRAHAGLLQTALLRWEALCWSLQKDWYHLRARAGFGLDQLAKSGGKLKSVLLYHVLPNGAFTPAQLAAAGSANTLLGRDLGASYPLSFATNATQGVRGHPLKGGQ